MGFFASFDVPFCLSFLAMIALILSREGSNRPFPSPTMGAMCVHVSSLGLLTSLSLSTTTAVGSYIRGYQPQARFSCGVTSSCVL